MTDVRLGQVRPTRMRRIGARHMIVLPAQQAQVLSIDDLERSLRTGRLQLQQLEQQIDRQRAFVADLEAQLASFAALPVNRVEDDPEVPQPQPEAGHLVGFSDPAVGELLRNAPRRSVAAAAERPVPQPELTAADA